MLGRESIAAAPSTRNGPWRCLDHFVSDAQRLNVDAAPGHAGTT
jgi:hypothetical protein